MSRTVKRIIGISLVVLVGLGAMIPLVAATTPVPSASIVGVPSYITDSTEVDGGGDDPPPIPTPEPPTPTQN